ncbi:MAG: hypothetical protein C4K58_04040 [Flavobacteriaceae bacterium]|nr:MAG: hypothetical protein C4K58_04040 [Flavobacteriaceae bacterium]
MFVEWLGHFHPLVLHIPIGLLFIGFIFVSLELFKKKDWGPSVLKLIYGVAVLGSAVSCLTGYFLIQNGEYSGELLENHKWGAVILLIATSLYFLSLFTQIKSITKWIGSLVLLLGVSLVGHDGGSITHGSDFLDFPKEEEEQPVVDSLSTLKNDEVATIPLETPNTEVLTEPEVKPENAVITSQPEAKPEKGAKAELGVQSQKAVKSEKPVESSKKTEAKTEKDAVVKTQPSQPKQNDQSRVSMYTGVIAPLFDKKCNSCHGENKQKGGLRMDTPAYLKQGGKSGASIVVGSPESSELIKRILLPLEDDDHMPPAEKPQCTDKEIEEIRKWILSGAPYE